VETPSDDRNTCFKQFCQVTPQAAQKQIEKALERPLSQEQGALLIAHLAFVLEWNRKLNLTRVCSWEDGVILHIEDSLSALPEIESAPEGPFVDLGSGGGFPGIPLAIVGGRQATLVEATGKKAQLLQRFVKENGLTDHIAVEALRAETFARQTTEYFAVVTARALASLSALMELAAPLLQPGGILLAYKGVPAKNELEKATSLEDELGMTIIGQRSLVLSDGISRRTIIQVQKTAAPKRKLPRREGQAQKL
jgi:16S rRNA (guanine527-N7)-methyltransferase